MIDDSIFFQERYMAERKKLYSFEQDDKTLNKVSYKFN